MSTETNRAALPKVAPIRFQPVLPQPAHPIRSLFGFGIPAFFAESLAVIGMVWITAGTGAVPSEQITVVSIVELLPEVSLPKPPPPPERLPSAPVTAAADAPEEVKGFQELAMPMLVLSEIPPPPVIGTVSFNAMDFTGEGAPGGRGLGTAEPEPVEAGPVFTPYTVAPFLKNSRDVARNLVREYPQQLRSAKIGGRVLLWLFIDDTGTVRDAILKTSSGFAALDEAAMRVAMSMEFSAAINRDRRVPVWVAVPVDFEVV